MSSGSVTLPVVGGGGGGGITSINGDTTPAQTIAGSAPIGVTSGGGVTTISLATPLTIMQGGTGQSNQQAALNNLTDIGSHTDGDVLQLLSGNAQFAPYTPPPPSGFGANTFAGFDSGGTLESIPDWDWDNTSHGAQVNSTQNVINDGFHDWNYYNLTLNPSIASPTAIWTNIALQANIDTGSSGFNIGTDGQALRMIDSYIAHNGTSNTGGITHIQLEGDIGNGTDAITINGFSYCFGFGNFHANVNLNGSMQGYTFQPSLDAAVTTTSSFNVQAFVDDFQGSAQTVYGYTSYACNPLIGTIPNNSGFTAINISPTIGSFTGNAGFGAVSVSGTYTTIGSSGWTGVTVTPNITNGHGYIGLHQANPQIAGGDANVELYQGNMSQVTTTGNTNVLNLSGLTASNNQSGFSADNIRTNLGGVMVAADNQGVQGQHVIFTQYSTPNSTTITGTDVIVNILSPDINFGDSTSHLTMGPSGLGFNMVGFAGQMHGHGTIDQVAAVIPAAIFAEDFTLPEFRNVNAIIINAGYTGACTNATAFYHEIVGAGLFATNHWGLKVVSDVDNYVTKMAINTATEKANAVAALDVESTTKGVLFPRMTTAQRTAITAVEGLVLYDTDLHQLGYYNGTSWVLL